MTEKNSDIEKAVEYVRIRKKDYEKLQCDLDTIKYEAAILMVAQKRFFDVCSFWGDEDDLG